MRTPAFLILAFALTGCGSGSSSPGLSLDWTVSLEPLDGPAAMAGTKSFLNTEGQQIRLDTAYLTLSSIELSSDCHDSGFVLAPRLFPLLAQLLDAVMPAAYAHSEGSPTLLGVPHVIDLTGPDGEVIALGAVFPPPDTYCGGRWQIAAADEDAVGLPADLDMVGHSLRLRGAYGEPARAFSLDVTLSFLPIERRLPAPLVLNEQQPTASIELVLHYDRWFDGLDLPALAAGDDNQRALLLGNIRSQLSVNVSG